MTTKTNPLSEIKAIMDDLLTFARVNAPEGVKVTVCMNAIRFDTEFDLNKDRSLALKNAVAKYANDRLSRKVFHASCNGYKCWNWYLGSSFGGKRRGLRVEMTDSEKTATLLGHWA